MLIGCELVLAIRCYDRFMSSGHLCAPWSRARTAAAAIRARGATAAVPALLRIDPAFPRIRVPASQCPETAFALLLPNTHPNFPETPQAICVFTGRERVKRAALRWDQTRSGRSCRRPRPTTALQESAANVEEWTTKLMLIHYFWGNVVPASLPVVEDRDWCVISRDGARWIGHVK